MCPCDFLSHRLSLILICHFCTFFIQTKQIVLVPFTCSLLARFHSVLPITFPQPLHFNEKITTSDTWPPLMQLFIYCFFPSHPTPPFLHPSTPTWSIVPPSLLHHLVLLLLHLYLSLFCLHSHCIHQILESVHHIHQHDIVHRDLKVSICRGASALPPYPFLPHFLSDPLRLSHILPVLLLVLSHHCLVPGL